MIADSLPAMVPTKIVGPITINFGGVTSDILVPMTTSYEAPLWNSVNRGANISNMCGGINVCVSSGTMTRSVVVECEDAIDANRCMNWVLESKEKIAELVEGTSNFAKLMTITAEVVGQLLFVRVAIDSNKAAGHNMATKAAQEVVNWIVNSYGCKHMSVSGNYCTDKKNSAVNGILGRGKRVSADIVISNEICEKILRTTPERMHSLNINKNLVGSILSGGVRTANAHFANMLLSVYLATGQDAANIIEGSQGITYTNVIKEDNGSSSLYFSVNLPNVIVGTVGSGKNLTFVQRNLEILGCNDGPDSSMRLAAIVGATVLCGELSLLAALTNNGELIKAHLALERGQWVL